MTESSIDKEIEAIRQINKILTDLNDEEATDRIIEWTIDKFCYSNKSGRRDLLRNIEFVLRKHSELMVEMKHIKDTFANSEKL